MPIGCLRPPLYFFLRVLTPWRSSSYAAAAAHPQKWHSPRASFFSSNFPLASFSSCRLPRRYFQLASLLFMRFLLLLLLVTVLLFPPFRLMLPFFLSLRQGKRGPRQEMVRGCRKPRMSAAASIFFSATSVSSILALLFSPSLFSSFDVFGFRQRFLSAPLSFLLSLR